MNNAIEVSGLCYRVKSFEISDFALTVPAGSVYGFLGPNGAGKTTTIQLLLGQRRAARGQMTVLGGTMPRDAARLLQKLGYVPERSHLYSGLTVAEGLRYHAAFYPSWDSQRAVEMLGRFGLEGDHRIGGLSKGETGKLMVLLALAQRPELLVLDEPTDGLDPVVRRDVIGALLDYVSRHSATVFISSHLVHELERICDWVGLMDRGRLVAEMPMQNFKNGIKRLRVAGAPATVEEMPFVLLSRESTEVGGTGEIWVVRGWQPPMQEYFTAIGAILREVVDLDLEEGFVELLRTFRGPHSKEA